MAIAAAELAADARRTATRLDSIAERLETGGADAILGAQIVGNVIADLAAALVRLAERGAS